MSIQYYKSKVQKVNKSTSIPLNSQKNKNKIQSPEKIDSKHHSNKFNFPTKIFKKQNHKKV